MGSLHSAEKKHFGEDCFEYGSSVVEKYKVSRLKRDEIEITAVPSLPALERHLWVVNALCAYSAEGRCVIYLFIMYIFILRFSLNLDIRIRIVCVSMSFFIFIYITIFISL